MQPRAVIYLNEYYRILTSSLFHSNLMHIGMNMMSTFAISTMLEKRMGSMRLMFTIVWSMILTSLIYIAVAYAAYIFFGKETLMLQQSLGFSGIIFHMSVIECNISPSLSRSVFGFITVPSYLYPWVLLILLQMVMPNLSFLGHLAGILTGTLQYYGVLDYVIVSESYLQYMENWNAMRWITNRPNFISTPSDGATSFQQEPSALGRSLRKGFWMILRFTHNIIETIWVCIFGRGNTLNLNIRLGSWPFSRGSTGSSSSDVEAVDEEDDWVGLPPMPSPDRESLSRIV